MFILLVHRGRGEALQREKERDIERLVMVELFLLPEVNNFGLSDRMTILKNPRKTRVVLHAYVVRVFAAQVV